MRRRFAGEGGGKEHLSLIPFLHFIAPDAGCWNLEFARFIESEEDGLSRKTFSRREKGVI